MHLRYSYYIQGRIHYEHSGSWRSPCRDAVAENAALTCIDWTLNDAFRYISEITRWRFYGNAAISQ